MAEHERLFSAISAYVAKLPNVVLENDLASGTMSVVFKSHVPSDGQPVALKIYGTRNVEITTAGAVDFHNFRRIAHLYSNALELLDVFHLIEVETAEPAEPESGKGGLRIARAMRAER
ncbi:MAG TPA: hypothetical protein VMG12_20915 [Polyangiaceae bacterium]|nr:hypothetical protein [Polyangiaceae bacterium]